MGQSLTGMKYRRETSFKVNHAVFAQILGLFISHALERLFRLHHRDGVGKAFEIFGQAPLVGALMEPIGKRGRVIQALRQVVRAAGAAEGIKANVDVVE